MAVALVSHKRPIHLLRAIHEIMLAQRNALYVFDEENNKYSGFSLSATEILKCTPDGKGATALTIRGFTKFDQLLAHVLGNKDFTLKDQIFNALSSVLKEHRTEQTIVPEYSNAYEQGSCYPRDSTPIPLTEHPADSYSYNHDNAVMYTKCTAIQPVDWLSFNLDSLKYIAVTRDALLTAIGHTKFEDPKDQTIFDFCMNVLSLSKDISLNSLAFSSFSPANVVSYINTRVHYAPNILKLKPLLNLRDVPAYYNMNRLLARHIIFEVLNSGPRTFQDIAGPYYPPPVSNLILPEDSWSEFAAKIQVIHLKDVVRMNGDNKPSLAATLNEEDAMFSFGVITVPTHICTGSNGVAVIVSNKPVPEVYREILVTSACVRYFNLVEIQKLNSSETVLKDFVLKDLSLDSILRPLELHTAHRLLAKRLHNFSVAEVGGAGAEVLESKSKLHTIGRIKTSLITDKEDIANTKFQITDSENKLEMLTREIEVLNTQLGYLNEKLKTSIASEATRRASMPEKITFESLFTDSEAVRSQYGLRLTYILERLKLIGAYVSKMQFINTNSGLEYVFNWSQDGMMTVSPDNSVTENESIEDLFFNALFSEFEVLRKITIEYTRPLLNTNVNSMGELVGGRSTIVGPFTFAYGASYHPELTLKANTRYCIKTEDKSVVRVHPHTPPIFKININARSSFGASGNLGRVCVGSLTSGMSSLFAAKDIPGILTGMNGWICNNAGDDDDWSRATFREFKTVTIHKMIDPKRFPTETLELRGIYADTQTKKLYAFYEDTQIQERLLAMSQLPPDLQTELHKFYLYELSSRAYVKTRKVISITPSILNTGEFIKGSKTDRLRAISGSHVNVHVIPPLSNITKVIEIVPSPEFITPLKKTTTSPEPTIVVEMESNLLEPHAV